jgi:hypothetical protein
LAHKPYQTSVVTVGSAGDVLVAKVSGVLVEVGTGAKRRLGVDALVTALVGPLPNPPTPSTRYPHVSALSVVGDDCEALTAGTEVELPARLLLVPVSVKEIV